MLERKKVNRTSARPVSTSVSTVASLPTGQEAQRRDFLKVAVVPVSAHLEDARNAETLRLTTEAGIRSLHFRTAQENAFQPLEWYRKQETDHQEWLARREAERKARLGLVSCAYPKEWTAHREGKNLLLKELASFCVSICLEHAKGDCYQIGFTDVEKLIPRFEKRGIENRQLPYEQRGKLLHAAMGKLFNAILPVRDQFTGKITKEGCPACRLSYERIEKSFDYLVFLEY